MSYEPQEVTIKHRAFRYFVEKESIHMPGTTILRPVIAMRGDVVTIPRELDYNHGVSQDAFVTVDPEAPEISGEMEAASSTVRLPGGEQVSVEVPEPEGAGSGRTYAPVDEMSLGELVEFLEQEKPSVAETVALAGDNDETKRAVLEAEQERADMEPRKGVVEALSQ
jgi:hypothetical protein